MTLRVVEIDGGGPWFVAKDGCDALGLTNPTMAVRHLDADEKAKFGLGLPGRTPLVVSESGLYALIMRSRKPEARSFRKWVTSEVLPSIRRHGMYMTQEVAREAIEDPMALMARAVLVANERLGIMTTRAHGLGCPHFNPTHGKRP